MRPTFEQLEERCNPSSLAPMDAPPVAPPGAIKFYYPAGYTQPDAPPGAFPPGEWIYIYNPGFAPPDAIGAEYPIGYTITFGAALPTITPTASVQTVSPVQAQLQSVQTALQPQPQPLTSQPYTPTAAPTDAPPATNVLFTVDMSSAAATYVFQRLV
jgi:hypothetical protein